MNLIPARRTALGVAALTVIGTAASIIPANASPSFPVVCASAQADAPRNQVTTFTLSCEDQEGNPVDEYVVVTAPGKAESFAVDAVTGDVSYRPAAGANGTDTFTFKGVVQGLGESAPTQATITLGNERPVCPAVPAVTAPHGRPTTVALSCTDADGDTVVVDAGTVGATHGTVTPVDGGVVYTPTAGYLGADSFTLRGTDGDLFSEEVTVAVTVANTRPVCTGGSLSVVHDRSRTVNLGCTDGDDDALVRSVVAKAQHGKVSVSGGRLTYVPAAGYVGTDTFTVAATDGLQASVPVRFDVRVTNALPTCTGGGRVVAVRTRRAPVRISCSDRDGDAVRPVVATSPRHGRIVRVGTRWYYVARRGFVGRDSFRLAGTDGVGRSKPLSYAVTVRRR